MATATGFFVDWDGNTRRVEAPGDGLVGLSSDRRGHGSIVERIRGWACNSPPY